MSKPNRQTIRAAVVVALLVVFAALLRSLGRSVDPSGIVSAIIGTLRGLTYLGLFSFWGLSLRRRIIQTQARRFLGGISALMVFWVAVRTLKFMFFADIHTGRFLWYLYYIPILFIPLLALFIALSLGKSEEYRLPRRTYILLCVSALFVILVLTNDFHQIVFGFPYGLLHFGNGEYTHCLGYYIIMGWAALCTVTALVFIAVKCRVPYSRQLVFLPCIPLAALVIYAVLYLAAHNFIYVIAGDMTVVICVLTALAFEACIQCGLIQRNTHYDELFECTGIRAIIADENYDVLLSSAGTEPLSKDIMRKTEAAPVMLDNGLRLRGAPIKKGRVLWLEDVSEIAEVIAELADNSEYLTSRKIVLHREVETRKKERRLAEQNRLYNRLMNDNKEELALFSDLLLRLEATDDAEQERKLTARLAIVCTHIKRSGNMLFLSEKGEKIRASEVRFALMEWLSNLRLCGVKCSLYFNADFTLGFSETVALYDAFQRVLLCALDSMLCLLVTVSEKGGAPFLLLNTSCDCDLFGLSRPGVSVSDEGDNEWVVTIDAPKGGASA